MQHPLDVAVFLLTNGFTQGRTLCGLRGQQRSKVAAGRRGSVWLRRSLHPIDAHLQISKCSSMQPCQSFYSSPLRRPHSTYLKPTCTCPTRTWSG